MRRFALALFAVCIASGAAADGPDYPVLRGPNFVPPAPTYYDWSGVYFGGHGVYGTSGMDFARSTSSLVAFILRNSTAEDLLHASTWTTLPRTATSANGVGGFIGYNSQWDDAVLGIEAGYTHMSLESSATDFISRFQVSGNTKYSVAINSSASLQFLDYATLRGRAGYAMGPFLPYATLGGVVARANVNRTATVTELEYDVTDPANPVQTGGIGTVTKSEAKNNTFVFGYSGGLGFDLMLMPNVFARAEWEYIRFQNIEGITANINNARVGLGMKF